MNILKLSIYICKEKAEPYQAKPHLRGKAESMAARARGTNNFESKHQSDVLML